MYVVYAADWNVLVSCMPIASSWDYTLDFTCVDLKALFTTALATDVATDCKPHERRYTTSDGLGGILTNA
jgi:hypothetical protein